MNHLAVLKWLDWAWVALLALGLAITGVSAALPMVLLLALEPAALKMGLPAMAISGLALAMLVGAMVLAVLAARGVERGQGRVAQTLLAVAMLPSVPLGSAFGLYALWVVWVNPETRATFEGSGRRELPALFLGIALLLAPLVPLVWLTIAAALPTDLAALDAEYEPIADRSHRIERPGCGLTEVGPDCAPARPTGVRTEDVSFPVRNTAMGWTELRGTLHLPEGLDGPRPAVVLVHGSGPADRDGKAPGELVQSVYRTKLATFEILADHLARQGLVVLRYDKRACPRCYPDEHAAADYGAFRFELFVDDALAAGDYLASRPEVDGRLVVVGHSQGGGFAPHIASRDDRYVAAVMLAGFTGSFRDAMIDQLERIAAIREAQHDRLGAWSVRLQADYFASCLDRLDGDYDPADPCLGGGVSLQAVADYEALNATTQEVIRDLGVPLCAIAGTVDRNVPPEELLAIREARAGGDGEYHLVAGVGHGLRDLVQVDDPPQLDPAVLAALDGCLATVRPVPEPAPAED